jgi:hypothetical protein
MGLILNEPLDFLIVLLLTATLYGPESHLNSDRNDYYEHYCRVNDGRQARKTDNLAAICEQIL